MPPKLTSKNIFDVVFDQLPADAFIDTGPASLKEELILEASGMLGSSGKGPGNQRSAQRGGSNVVSSGSDGGGTTSYRRHLLPSAFVAATAAVVRSKARSVPAVPEDSPAAAVEQRKDLQDSDVLDAEELEGSTAAPLSAQAPPPDYAAASASSTVVSSEGVFRRVDDEVADLRADRFAVRRRGGPDAPKRCDGGRNATATEGGLDMQMDAEDEAVREATKYAGCVAEMQAAKEASAEQQLLCSWQPIGGGGPLATLDARLASSKASAGIGPSFSAVGRGTELSVSCDAAAEGVATPKAMGATTESSLATPTAELVAVGVSSAAVSGAASARAEGQIGDRTLLSYTSGGSQTGSAVRTGVSGCQSASTAGDPLLQQPFGFAGAPQKGGTFTAAEQLILMPPGLDRVYTGTCVMYRHPKNFGFISPDLGGPDVFFITDSIALSFTRLALRAFYLRNGLPVPPLVAAAYRVGPAKANSIASGEDGAPTNGTTTSVVNAGTASDANGSVPAPVSSVSPGLTGVAGGISAAGDGQTRVTGTALGEEGVLGSTPVLATRAGDTGDRVLTPPTTGEELAWAEAAASLLTSATAQLLQHQVNQGIGGGLRVGDRLSFVVSRNHAARGGNGRLLRAEFLRGVPAAQLAMAVEQSWFHPLFPGAVGRKTSTPYRASLRPPPPPPSSSTAGGGGAGDEAGMSATAYPLAPFTSATSTLTRYTGCVRTYDAEEQRGYIRCDELSGSGGGNTPDVIFYPHSVLWDLTRCPPLKRQVKECMRLAYSVCGTERNGKYIATLITTPSGAPFCEDNMTFAENVLPFFAAETGGAGWRRGRGEDGNSVGGGRSAMGMDSGAGASAEGIAGDRKRVKAAEDDMLLLYAEDDYPYM
ncbi:hypothetical protein, conserved [Leishmania shawi]|uniref:Uncharacterized protein n=1 Tax=Leishmania shawi TaxID=5680 RepID=A0ABR3ECF7_9TRYP